MFTGIGPKDLFLMNISVDLQSAEGHREVQSLLKRKVGVFCISFETRIHLKALKKHGTYHCCVCLVYLEVLKRLMEVPRTYDAVVLHLQTTLLSSGCR